MFASCSYLDTRKNALRLLQIIMLWDFYKLCLDETNLPYLSMPSYIKGAYVLVFPHQFYRYVASSSDAILTSDEKVYLTAKEAV